MFVSDCAGRARSSVCLTNLGATNGRWQIQWLLKQMHKPNCTVQASVAAPDIGQAKGAVQRVFPLIDRVPAIDGSSDEGQAPASLAVSVLIHCPPVNCCILEQQSSIHLII